MTERKETAAESSIPSGEDVPEQGRLVSDEVIREFIDTLRLKAVRLVTARLVLMSEVCQGLAEGELGPDHVEVLRRTALRLNGEEPSRLREAIVEAVDGEKDEWRRVMETLNRVREQMTGNRGSDSDSEVAEIVNVWVAVARERRKQRSRKKEGREKSGKGVAPRRARTTAVIPGAIAGGRRGAISEKQVCRFIAACRLASALTGDPDGTTRAAPRCRTPQQRLPGGWGSGRRGRAPRAMSGSSPRTAMERLWHAGPFCFTRRVTPHGAALLDDPGTMAVDHEGTGEICVARSDDSEVGEEGLSRVTPRVRVNLRCRND